jgi:hypothetical protein
MTEEIEEIVKGTLVGARYEELEDGSYSTIYEYKNNGGPVFTHPVPGKTGIVEVIKSKKVKLGEDKFRRRGEEVYIISYTMQKTLHSYIPSQNGKAA